jgi:nitrite reductase/ring-hydroxylating ferredoxin subunit
MQEVRLCPIDELVDGESRGFDPLGAGQDSVLVVRQGAGLYIYKDVCPHEGSPMAWRRHAYLNAARDRIVCNAHGAQFDIPSGRCLLGPCLGQSLQRLAHRIDAQGGIWLSMS